jgi:hypothetical protein
VVAVVLVPVLAMPGVGLVFRVLSWRRLSGIWLSWPWLSGAGTLRQAHAVLRAAIRQVRVADGPGRACRLRRLVLAAVVLLPAVLLPTVLLTTVLLAGVACVATSVLG